MIDFSHAVAFKSRTLYLGRDQPSDRAGRQAAEARVRAWREGGSPPFP
jgi:hypothetical protein